ncbi:tryptophan-rich antigen [Plasmodium gonderi]|uniref:Tryptophan-rich antigen n=1 Tax=Plasmodium gonderi TaxID=77519 RepID=A0A1Y1JFT0_PLAGO|nr:tryptophan-rich antigen [Plasmodium gonderi]GAW79602.1 tryptophan-rich antigen [Plasmodium gonderi]
MENIKDFQELTTKTLSLPVIRETGRDSLLSIYQSFNKGNIFNGIVLVVFLIFLYYLFQILSTLGNKVKRLARNAISFKEGENVDVEKERNELMNTSVYKTKGNGKEEKINNTKNEPRNNNEQKESNHDKIKAITRIFEKKGVKYNTNIEGNDKRILKLTEINIDNSKNKINLLHKITESNKKEKIRNLIKKMNPLQIIDHNDQNSNEELHEDKSDEWKNMEWNNWMTKTEDEWKIFNTSIENEKTSWIQANEKEWDDWLESIQNKWIYYNENMDEEHKINLLTKSSEWDETQWVEWIKTECKQYIEQEWKKWLRQKESNLGNWVVNKWIQWKNSKITEWLMTDWRIQDEASCSNYDYNKITNLLKRKERKKWNICRERINKEREEWNAWVQSKENLYVNTRWSKWSKWKKNKSFVLSKLVEMFINKLIIEKQWTKWTQTEYN